MIISRAHKLVFIHVPKAAGSSVEVSLMRYLRRGDVFAGSVRDAYREHALPPLSCFADFLDAADLTFFLKQLVATGGFGEALHRAAKDHFLRRGLEAHSSWQVARDAVGPAAWEEYETFAIERNPWDKMASQYFYDARGGEPGRVPFRDYIESFARGENPFGRPPAFAGSWRLYADDSGIRVKEVGRYERLEEDLARILAHTDIAWDGWLPEAKASFRPDKGAHAYRELYDPESRATVARVFAREIAHFGYEF